MASGKASCKASGKARYKANYPSPIKIDKNSKQANYTAVTTQPHLLTEQYTGVQELSRLNPDWVTSRLRPTGLLPPHCDMHGLVEFT